MKIKLITFIPVMIFIIGIISAVGISVTDKNIDLSKEQRSALITISLDNYNYTDTELNGTYQRCLFKEDCHNEIFEICTYNEISENYCYDLITEVCEEIKGKIICHNEISLECIEENHEVKPICHNETKKLCNNIISLCSGYLNTTEITLDTWENNTIKNIADAEINRDNIPVEVNKGGTTITSVFG